MAAITQLKAHRAAAANETVDLSLEKDETEKRLERLIFGTETDFLNALHLPPVDRNVSLAPLASEEDVEGLVRDEDLEELADEELFFLDSGSATLSNAISLEVRSKETNTLPSNARNATWADSDDDRITVSLASHSRLRKLRELETDDVIDGREYIRRLRRQYALLHPPPEWANPRSNKRRRSHEVSDSDSDTGMLMDPESIPRQVEPLAELLRSGGELTRIHNRDNNLKKRRKLRPETIDIHRMSDVVQSSSSSIDTLEFHSIYPILLSAGPASTIYLHHVSPQPPHPNPLLTSLHVKGTPLHTASFCKNGVRDQSATAEDTRIFLSSRRRYFHVWSLSNGSITKASRPVYGTARVQQKTLESFKLSPCGRYMGLIGSSRKGGGVINVLSASSMQWVASCRIDSRGGIADFAWWRNGGGFAVVGKNGEVSEYDIEAMSVVARWVDEGAVGTTVISLGGESDSSKLGGDRWVAIGSSSGIVNVYDRREWASKKLPEATDEEILELAPHRPRPARVFDQLTTPISHLTFASDGQLLVMASRWKNNALRLVHLPSLTVYQNWPTGKTPLGRVTSTALSPDATTLALGNEQGKIRLFEIRD